MTALPERRHERLIDSPMQDRRTSSPAILAQRVREVGRAWREGDEPAVRTELRVLAAEAQLLATMEPLPLGLLDQRQRIAAEADGLGRIG